MIPPISLNVHEWVTRASSGILVLSVPQPTIAITGTANISRTYQVKLLTLVVFIFIICITVSVSMIVCWTELYLFSSLKAFKRGVRVFSDLRIEVSVIFPFICFDLVSTNTKTWTLLQVSKGSEEGDTMIGGSMERVRKDLFSPRKYLCEWWSNDFSGEKFLYSYSPSWTSVPSVSSLHSTLIMRKSRWMPSPWSPSHS